jgi:4-amino-4-deoxy-L-arabinose transferase-like glycosyltransferase
MKKYLPLLLIFLIGVLLRFVSLGNVPVGFHRDEAFLGYNAYSILKTGRDISGNFLPLNLKSFFYSPAGYSYFSIPFIWAFGLSAFSVRFASALFGSFTIILVYWLVVDLFNLFIKEERLKKKSKITALMSAGMLAISPWHINLSRTATENTLVTFFIVLGVLLFLRYLKHNDLLLLFFSFISLFITLFIYQAPRAFMPIFIPFLAIIFWNKLKRLHKIFIIAFYLILIIIPVFLVLTSTDLSTRIRSLSIFEFPQTKIMVNDWILTDGVTKNPYVFTRMFHNKVSGYFLTFSENLASHFSYGFLFSDKGFPDRYRIPSVGLLYPFEIILIFIALVRLFNSRLKTGILLIGWILIAFSGAALTFDDIPNLQRTLIAVPAFSILSGFGLFELFEIIKSTKGFKIVVAFVSLIILYSVGFYLIQYYSYGKNYRPWYRQDGYKELVAEVNSNIMNYKEAVITTREGAPTIFFLFFSKYDPQTFQNETKNINTFASDHINFGSYVFSSEECPVRIDNITKQLTGQPGTLYVNSALCGEIPKGTHLIDELYRVDESRVFQILTLD